MSIKPSPRSTIDIVDDSWEASASRASRSSRPPRPVRGGTNPWDDRVVLHHIDAGNSIRIQHAEAPGQPRPVRLGTGSWDDLLPAAVKRRRELYAVDRARQKRPVRGGTRTWDELITAIRADASALHLEADDAVFGSEARDPLQDLPEHLRAWLEPNGPKSSRG